ncbi:MAG: CCA tRNA nucleotidyltransferase [Lachnospiraceae bacterium]|nr:CCA tRNA nucleotidyltransferase [Lachnospiraceae bacterium]
MKINIPDNVSYIIRTLNRAGYEAYAVGGCVRDMILERNPQDWDITTSAMPGEVKRLFRRTVDTGIKHGTVTVLMRDKQYEVTTFRVDGDYKDGRHPESVTFTPCLSEDLLRRDFTINAMAYHPDEGIVDLHGGMDDIKNKVIRAVGDPDARFDEDALRIMRAIRFAAQLGFDIEPKTLAAISHHAPRLDMISRERIQAELTKLLVSPHPEKILLLYESGITTRILPVFDDMMILRQNNPYHRYTVGIHTVKMLENIDADPILRWTALLHDSGKTKTHMVDESGYDHFYGHGKVSALIADELLHELRFDNNTIAKVTTLIRFHDYRFTMTKKDLRKIVSIVTPELFPSLMKVMRADNLAKSPMAISTLIPALDDLQKLYDEILAEGDCLTLKDLAVGGSDLIKAGMKPGPEIGILLKEMFATVLDDPSKNDKALLMQLFKDKIPTG